MLGRDEGAGAWEWVASSATILDVVFARHRLALSAAAVAALSLGEAARPASTAGAFPGSPPVAAPEPLPLAPCPPGTLPDGDMCVHLPGSNEDSLPEVETEVSAHHDRRGRWVVYDQIPRRPDRPADYDMYLYPVPCERGCVASGYDLDLPDDRQRRGRRLSHVGHGAVDLLDRKGQPVVIVPLEHQEGDAEVVYVGPLFGMTVVTRHTLRESGQVRDYLLLFAHLDAASAGLRAGTLVKVGDTIGFVGDSGSPELVHLHLEARRVRTGVDVTKLDPAGLVANENTVVCDPRNVLPLR
jgi:murein DD-endopeptidase MepM/ murein hydrolase activator NlpD